MATATATQAEIDPSQPTIPGPPWYRLTVDEFERIADSLNDGHAELLEGRIIGSSEMKPGHVLAAELTRTALQPLIPPGWYLREEKPVRIPESSSEPRPDFSVARGAPLDYADRHPEPREIGLLIEIADATLAYDRGDKSRTYAAARIPVYWILNLVDRWLEVYSGPSSSAYSRRDYRPGQRAPLIIDRAEVGTVDPADLLPPPAAKTAP